MNPDVYRRGMEDYWKGKCLVYRNVKGALRWDIDDDMGVDPSEREAWAESYIAGYNAASNEAERDSLAMCSARK